MKFKEMFIEAAHPDITAIKKASIAKGLKAKYAHYQLTIPMGKMSEADALKNVNR